MTAIQFPMFTLPIPPANPLMWGQVVSLAPAPPPQVPPTFASLTSDPSGGGFGVDFSVGTDVASSGYIEYGPTTAYGSQATLAGSGLAGDLLRASVTFADATPIHWRAVVTGTTAPNQSQAVSADQSVSPQA